jgi:signal peptidase I
VAVSAHDDSSKSDSQDQGQDQDQSQVSTKKKPSFIRSVVEFVVIIVIALALATGIRTFIAQPFFVPSGSMEQTLQIDDRVIAAKIATEISGVKRGEIMVFKDPGDWLPPMEQNNDGWRSVVAKILTFVGLLPSDSGDDLVKRVIGIEGDQVACCNQAGQIVLNGVPLDESAYVNGPTDQVLFDITVPKDSMFVMGDNRGNSADSRFHLDQNDGAIPNENAVGRVVAVVWPLSRLTIETIPEIFGNSAIAAGNEFG